MITSRCQGYIRLHVLLKLLGCMALFWLLIWSLHFFIYGDRLLPGNYLRLFPLVPAAAVIEVLTREQRFRSLHGLSRERVWSVTQREVLFLLVMLFGVVVMTKDGTFSRVFLASFGLGYSMFIAWMNLVGHRLIYRQLYRRARNCRAEAIVLAPPGEIREERALEMSAMVPGSEILGFVRYGEGDTGTMPLPVLGGFEDMGTICRQTSAGMLITMGLDRYPELIRQLQQFCDSLGMRFIWVDNKEESFRGHPDIRPSGSRVLLSSWREPLEDPLNRVAKRFFDLVVALPVVVLVLPLLSFLVWIIHRRFSPGPLFYRQERTGRDGEIFEILKFRTMVLNDDPAAQATEGDSRIFPGGRFLRKYSLDEFPQFLNVWRGEMSIVGPRPHYIEHDELFAHSVGDYRVRHFAKPGITGLAQIKGKRGETDTELKIRQRARYDIFYLRHWSLFLDLWIFCCTFFQVLSPPESAR